MKLKRLPGTTPVAAAVALLCASPVTYGQGAGEITLPEISVSSGQNSQEMKENRVRAIGPELPEPGILRQAAQPASVVDRQEIERVNSGSTLELLARTPGVSMNRSGGIAGTAFVRGMNTNDMRVPLFIDGDRFRGRNTLQFMLLSPSEIERIEVLRGPASSIYGSDGLTGLINIVTRRPSPARPGQPFGLVGGEFGLSWRSNNNGLQADAAIEMAGNGFDLRAYVSGRHADDYRSGDRKIPNSDYETLSGGLVLGYSPDARQRVELSLRATTVDDGSASTLPTYTLQSRRDPLEVKQARIAYTGESDSGLFRKIDASLYANEFDTVIHSHNTTRSDRITDSYNHVQGPVIFGGHISGVVPWKQTVTTVGMDFMHEHFPGTKTRAKTTLLDANGNITSVAGGRYAQNVPNTTWANAGAFANIDWNISPRWLVSAAGRYDWFFTDVKLSPMPSEDLVPIFREVQDQTESAVTGSLSLSYRPTPVLEWVGSVGSAFRMPWSQEMFNSGFTGASYTIPNPGLKPERGVNVEAGVRLRFDKANLELTAFQSRFKDFLQTVTTSYEGLPATQRQNVGRARISGLEAQWRWQINREFNWFGNATLLRGTNRTTGDPLISIVPFSVLTGVQYVAPGGGYSITGELEAARRKSRISPAEYPTSGYGVINLYAELQLDRLGLKAAGNNTKLTLGVSNLFDKTYRSGASASNINYPFGVFNPLQEPGRSFNITLRSRF
ncbi:MAG: TonB-dependent receptor [Zoogloeaceae bacterium]|jgi:hemoglobin/transferrin/lactoferrin receptor protein|nr:TonB-dependent receptor [Zoogloeaceae bacterium]